MGSHIPRFNIVQQRQQLRSHGCDGRWIRGERVQRRQVIMISAFGIEQLPSTVISGVSLPPWSQVLKTSPLNLPS